MATETLSVLVEQMLNNMFGQMLDFTLEVWEVQWPHS